MFIFLFLSFSFLSMKAQAQEVRRFYTSARYLAMGGAQVSIASDETALLANPAGLGRLRNSYGTIIDPELDGNMDGYTAYKAKAYTNPFELEQVKDTLLVSRDTHLHAREQLFPSFVVRNFGIGIYQKKSMDAQMNTAGDSMQTFYQDDVALVMGLNLRFFDGRIKVGANAKMISRIEIDKAIDPTGNMDLSTHASEGSGLSTDVGLILAAPWKFIPTISAVVRDLGGTKFDSGSGLRMQATTRPNQVEQDMDVGMALFPIHTNRIRSAFTLEYHKIKEAGLSQDKMKYYHFGGEVNLYDLFFVRAGLNGRYWTAGLELATEHTQIQLGSYGEEIATAPDTKEDRRYFFKFAFRF